MVKILDPVPRQRSLLDRFSDAMQAGVSSGAEFAGAMSSQRQQRESQQAEDDSISNLIGRDISGIRDPKIRQSLVTEALKGQMQSQQKAIPYQAGLETIKEMREIRKRGNLGRFSEFTGFFGGDTARDRGNYEQLGKSLISLASTIPIRNQKEFETLAKDLYNPSLTDAQADGILNAMESIISRSMGQGIGMQSDQTREQSKERPPLSSFHG